MDKYHFGQRVKLNCDPLICTNHFSIRGWEGIVVAIRKEDNAIIVKFEKERPRRGNATITSDFERMPGYRYDKEISRYNQALCDNSCIIELAGEEITGQVRVLRDL